jgi:hypothetical protein
MCLLRTAGTDLQGDERERAIRAATVVAGSRLCQAAAPAGAAGASSAAGAAPDSSDGGATGNSIEAWQLSMYLLQWEEAQRRQQQREAAAAAAPGEAASAPAATRRHVAKGTLAY